ncbi:MAG: DUF6438 domain-containing protein [Bacteroidota bacterium]
MIKNQWLGIGLLLMLSACGVFGGLSSSNNLLTLNLEKLTPLAELAKGPCFGQCPVFNMVVYSNGVVTYEGKENTNRKGLYINRISDADLKDLKLTLEAAKLWDFKDAYRGRIPDLPTVTVVHHENNLTKKIVGKDGRPEKVMNVQAALEQIATAPGWQLRNSGNASDLPSHIVGSEMRVRIHDNVDIYVWARKYRKYGMKVLEPISASSNYWLVGYNAQKNEAREVLAIVQADLQVLDAEFNRQATN